MCGPPATLKIFDAADYTARLERIVWATRHGAGKPQEYIRGPGGGTKGSSYPDVTAVKGDKTTRVNTVSTLKDGRTLTKPERKQVNKIKTAKPNDELRTVPKAKKPDGT